MQHESFIARCIVILVNFLRDINKSLQVLFYFEVLEITIREVIQADLSLCEDYWEKLILGYAEGRKLIEYLFCVRNIKYICFIS